ncbi:MAG: sodium:solute symporter [Alphaproteobacteria bacterium]|nr:sodium:solute symporter [Alphaproteobacteria bacterium]
MNPYFLCLILVLYFGILYCVAFITGKHSTNESFFVGTKNSRWYIVAFGMIGTSLSGITFISVPGTIGSHGFAYFQIAIGYLIGYFIIGYVLIPIYYKFNVTSIYKFLETSIGVQAYKTGAIFFIISRVLGATARLYLVIKILQIIILDRLQVPFVVTTFIILLMIWLYTQKGGVKTIIWTDTLQTFCMLFGLIFCIFFILNKLDLSILDIFKEFKIQYPVHKIANNWYNTDYNSPLFLGKQIIAGMLIAVTMTGMDQEMMQKNISVKTKEKATLNIIVVGFLVVIVIILFLILGGVLHLFCIKNHILNNEGGILSGDTIFPTVVMNYLPGFMSIIFLVALISALFPSADGALTALTSSCCIDLLRIKNRNLSDTDQITLRKKVHFVFTLIFLVCIMVFYWLKNNEMITIILRIATYTYGPILGLFCFGIILNKKINSRLVFLICILSPALCFLLEESQKFLFKDYRFGLEILFLNGLLTFMGLWLVSMFRKKSL